MIIPRNVVLATKRASDDASRGHVVAMETARHASLFGVERSVVKELDILLHAEDGFLGRAQAVREFNLLDLRAGGKFQGVSQERPGGNGT